MRKESEFCTNVYSQHQDLLLKEINVCFGKCLSCLYHIVDSFTQKSLTIWLCGQLVWTLATRKQCRHARLRQVLLFWGR